MDGTSMFPAVVSFTFTVCVRLAQAQPRVAFEPRALAYRRSPPAGKRGRLEEGAAFWQKRGTKNSECACTESDLGRIVKGALAARIGPAGERAWWGRDRRSYSSIMLRMTARDKRPPFCFQNCAVYHCQTPERMRGAEQVTAAIAPAPGLGDRTWTASEPGSANVSASK